MMRYVKSTSVLRAEGLLFCSGFFFKEGTFFSRNELFRLIRSIPSGEGPVAVSANRYGECVWLSGANSALSASVSLRCQKPKPKIEGKNRSFPLRTWCRKKADRPAPQNALTSFHTGFRAR